MSVVVTFFLMYVFFIFLLEDIQVIIQSKQTQTSSEWASANNPDFTVNWINIFPDWLGLVVPALFESF